MEKEGRNWNNRWIILIIVIIILGSIFYIIYDTKHNRLPASPSAQNNQQASPVDSANSASTANQAAVKSLSDKTSGFTVQECLGFCPGVYSIGFQVGQCQSSCNSIQPGSSLDEFCLNLVNVWKLEQNSSVAV